MSRYAPVTEAEAAHYEMLAAEQDFKEAFAAMQSAPAAHDVAAEYAVWSASAYAGSAVDAYLGALEVQFKYPEPHEFSTVIAPDWAIVAEWEYDIHGQQSLTKPPTLMNDYGVGALRNLYDSYVRGAHKTGRYDGGEVQARVDQHFERNGALHLWHYDSQGKLWHRAEIRIARP